MARSKSLGYLPVKEVSLSTRKASFVGSVVEFTVARQSKGTDFICSLVVMDVSDDDSSLTVNVFCKEKASLPHIRTYGDIICLHHVEIRDRNNEFYAVFNKKFSSFGLFGGKSCADLDPYQASVNFVISDHEKELIAQLRTWLTGHEFGSGASQYLSKLKDIKMGQYFDLVCKILHASELSGEGWTLYVWDGTDCPPLSFGAILSAQDAQPPLHVDQFSLSRSILQAFPCVGTAFGVTIGKDFEDLQLHLLPSGQWIKLRNITSEAQSGIWKGLVVPNSRVRLLSETDIIVKAYLRDYEERLSANRSLMPLKILPSPSQITGRQPYPTSNSFGP